MFQDRTRERQKMYASWVLCTAAAACVLFTYVENYSQQMCDEPCRPEVCQQIPNCPCGSYKDDCDCCTYCMKCPGDECSLVAMERCSNGTTCQAPQNADALARINGPGWCK